MSKFTFDCFVCDEALRTSDIKAVVDFGKKHADCTTPDPTQGDAS